MPSCGCARPALTSLSFGPGITLLRCAAHEAQSWVVDGTETTSADVLSSLRGLFIEQRGHRQPTTRAAAHPRRRSTAVPAHPAARTASPSVADSSPTDGQLTAALRARGISGAWSVA